MRFTPSLTFSIVAIVIPLISALSFSSAAEETVTLTVYNTKYVCPCETASPATASSLTWDVWHPLKSSTVDVDTATVISVSEPGHGSVVYPSTSNTGLTSLSTTSDGHPLGSPISTTTSVTTYLNTTSFNNETFTATSSPTTTTSISTSSILTATTTTTARTEATTTATTTSTTDPSTTTATTTTATATTSLPTTSTTTTTITATITTTTTTAVAGTTTTTTRTTTTTTTVTTTNACPTDKTYIIHNTNNNNYVVLTDPYADEYTYFRANQPDRSLAYTFTFEEHSPSECRLKYTEENRYAEIIVDEVADPTYKYQTFAMDPGYPNDLIFPDCRVSSDNELICQIVFTIEPYPDEDAEIESECIIGCDDKKRKRDDGDAADPETATMLLGLYLDKYMYFGTQDVLDASGIIAGGFMLEEITQVVEA